jgi:hypothetical protein
VRELDGDSAFTDVAADSPQLAGAVIHLNGNWSLDSDAGVAAPLAFHQRANRAKAGLGAFGRKRLVQDEMGPQVSGVSERGLGADNGANRFSPNAG